MKNRKRNTNSDMVVIVVMCAFVVVIFSLIVVLMANGKSNNDSNDVSGTGVNIPIGSDRLPESFIGSWWIPVDGHVLQSPRNTDMSEDEALADEYDFGVFLTHESYSTHRVGVVTNPCYKIQENCGAEAMDKVNMQSDGIMDEFSDHVEVTQIEVYTEDGGELCDTIFIIDGQYLVYYGTGNFVFCAAKVDAVG